MRGESRAVKRGQWKLEMWRDLIRSCSDIWPLPELWLRSRRRWGRHSWPAFSHTRISIDWAQPEAREQESSEDSLCGTVAQGTKQLGRAEKRKAIPSNKEKRKLAHTLILNHRGQPVSGAKCLWHSPQELSCLGTHTFIKISKYFS